MGPSISCITFYRKSAVLAFVTVLFPFRSCLLETAVHTDSGPWLSLFAYNFHKAKRNYLRLHTAGSPFPLLTIQSMRLVTIHILNLLCDDKQLTPHSQLGTQGGGEIKSILHVRKSKLVAESEGRICGQRPK